MSKTGPRRRAGYDVQHPPDSATPAQQRRRAQQREQHQHDQQRQPESGAPPTVVPGPRLLPPGTFHLRLVENGAVSERRHGWRRRADSNRRIEVLQTSALVHLATSPCAYILASGRRVRQVRSARSNCSDLKGLPSLSVSPEWPVAPGGLYRRAAPVVVCAPRYAPLKAAALLGVNGLPWGWHEEDRRSATLNSYRSGTPVAIALSDQRHEGCRLWTASPQSSPGRCPRPRAGNVSNSVPFCSIRIWAMKHLAGKWVTGIPPALSGVRHRGAKWDRGMVNSEWWIVDSRGVAWWRGATRAGLGLPADVGSS